MGIMNSCEMKHEMTLFNIMFCSCAHLLTQDAADPFESPLSPRNLLYLVMSIVANVASYMHPCF